MDWVQFNMFTSSRLVIMEDSVTFMYKRQPVISSCTDSIFRARAVDNLAFKLDPRPFSTCECNSFL